MHPPCLCIADEVPVRSAELLVVPIKGRDVCRRATPALPADGLRLDQLVVATTVRRELWLAATAVSSGIVLRRSARWLLVVWMRSKHPQSHVQFSEYP